MLLARHLGVVKPTKNALLIQGLGNTTIFCGDGINDLAALAAADVGMSVGASEAVIAAAISTPQGSVAGKASCMPVTQLSLHGLFAPASGHLARVCMLV